MPNAYDPASTIGMVRLLANDNDSDDYLFTDDEIGVFLTLEGNVVKLAAAQAIDTIADNEVLLAKAITTQDLATDGPKVAAELHKRAAALRAQHNSDLDSADDAGYFEIIPINGLNDGYELAEPEVDVL